MKLNNHFSKERRFLFSKKIGKIAQIRVNKGSCFPRGIFSPGKFDFNNSLPNFRRKLSTATSKCLIIESSRLSKFYFHGDPVIRNDPRKKPIEFSKISRVWWTREAFYRFLLSETEDYWSKFEETRFRGRIAADCACWSEGKIRKGKRSSR